MTQDGGVDSRSIVLFPDNDTYRCSMLPCRISPLACVLIAGLTCATGA